MKKMSLLLCGAVAVVLSSCGGSPKGDAEKLADKTFELFELQQKHEAKYRGTDKWDEYQEAYSDAIDKYKEKRNEIMEETRKAVKENRENNKKD